MPDSVKGPNLLARDLEARIAELKEQRAALPRSQRRPLNQRLHAAKQLLDWCKSRSGYVACPEELGLV